MPAILLVDDNDEFLAVAEEFIEASDDFRVTGKARNGFEALAMLEQARPDVLIVDISMPGMSGLEVTRKVKERWPGLPILILTLLDAEAHRQVALEAGADAFVVKSTMDTDLIPLLQKLAAARPQVRR